MFVYRGSSERLLRQVTLNQNFLRYDKVMTSLRQPGKIDFGWKGMFVFEQTNLCFAHPLRL